MYRRMYWSSSAWVPGWLRRWRCQSEFIEPPSDPAFPNFLFLLEFRNDSFNRVECYLIRSCS